MLFDLIVMDVPLISMQLFLAGMIESGGKDIYEGLNNIKKK